MEIVGVDPGIVHTGVVLVRFLPHVKTIEVLNEAVDARTVNRPVEREAQLWLAKHAVEGFHRERNQPRMFIEAYRPRSHFAEDKRMGDLIREFKRLFPKANVLDNTGVKKVVRPELLRLLGLWKFSTVTHHQDLRSAARIAVLGMLKDPDLNLVVSNVVRDHLAGRTWDVRQLS
jgi:hypothetical protein